MKTIFITGASSGIGKAAATLFAQNGWKVIATMRDTEKETELSAFPNVVKLKLDISDPLQIQDVVEKLLSSKQVDVVFNNAGYLLAGPMEGTTDEQLVSQITTNLLGPIRVTQAFIPHFREKKSGLFINTTSLAALIAGPFMSVYSASKAGLERWSFAMNLELGTFGIRVKTIIPGISKTNLLSKAAKASSAPYTEFMNKVVSTLTSPDILTIASTPEDIAKVVFEAATDENDQIRYLADTFARTSVSKQVGYGEETVQNVSNQQMFK